MSDTTITKIDSRHSPKGQDGEKYLASGTHVSMRMWENEQPADPKPSVARPYETVGYVLSGKAELHLAGQVVILEKRQLLGGAPKEPSTPTKSWKASRR